MNNRTRSAAKLLSLALASMIIGGLPVFLAGCGSDPTDPGDGAPIVNLSPPTGVFYSTFRVNRLEESYTVDLTGENKKLIPTTRRLYNLPANGYAAYSVGTGIEVVDLNRGVITASIPKPDGDIVNFNGVSLSPQGTHVAFTVHSDAPVTSPKIYIARIDGSEVTPMPVSATDAGIPYFSADGKKVAFATSTRDVSNSSQIHVLNIDGSGLVSIPVTSRYSGQVIGFSPDGIHLALLLSEKAEKVISNDLPENPRSWLAIADIGKRSITEIAETELNGSLEFDWSPDGKRIVYTTYGSDAGLHLAGVDMAMHRKIGMGEAADWSPDGKHIVYAGAVNGQCHLVLYNPVSGDSETLFPAAESNVYQPQWSPDGKHMLFIERTEPEKEISLIVLNPATKERTVLFSSKDLEVTVSGFWY